MDGDAPDPVTHLTDDAKFDALLVPKSDLLVASSHQHVLARGVEADRAGIEAELLISTDRLDRLSTTDRVNGELLIPAAADQDVITSVELLRAEPKAPDRLGRLLNDCELGAIFVSKEDLAIIECDGENLTIGRPIAIKTLLLGHKLVHVLSFSLPETEVVISAGGQTLQNRVEAKGLHGGVVRILKQTNTFGRPDDDVLIGATGGPPLAILGVGQAVDSISMRSLRVNHFA